MLNVLALSLVVFVAAPPAHPAGSVAPAEAAAVVVLRTGQTMVARSYAVEGRVVRIVDASGEPMVIRADRVDLEQSAAASRQRAAELAREAEQAKEEEQAAEARRRDAEERRARHLAMSSGTGSLSYAPETQPSPVAAEGKGSPAKVEPRSEPDQIPERDRRRAAELVARYNQLVKEHNLLVEEMRSPLVAGPQVATQIEGLRKQMDEIDRELAALETAATKG